MTEEATAELVATVGPARGIRGRSLPVLGVLLVASLSLPAAGEANSEPPGWDDVAPIFEENCRRCHVPGSVAPMALRTYAEARPWAKAIRRNVASGAMPPWFADPEVGSFSNDPRLSREEIETIVAWVDGGARGERTAAGPAEPPAAVEPTWQLGTPDVVVEMPEAFAIPAAGAIDYVYLRTPIGNEEARWVRAVEVLAGSRRHVHHIDVMVCSEGCTESGFYSELEPGVPTQPEREGDRERSKPEYDESGRVDGEDVEFYYSFLPGGGPLELPEGHGRLLPPRAELVLSLHYTTDGEAAEDRSRVGLYFLDEPPRRRVVSFFLDNPTIWVPAGSRRYQAPTRRSLARDAELLAVTPHMHFRGTSADLSVVPRDGSRRKILSVPDYDFSWQLTYVLEEPLALPEGSDVHLLNVFDNSADNPYNPDPTVDVGWGLQSWDEMSSAFLEFAVPLDAGPDSIFADPPRDDGNP